MILSLDSPHTEFFVNLSGQFVSFLSKWCSVILSYQLCIWVVVYYLNVIVSYMSSCHCKFSFDLSYK